jgi:tetratricopeptide (TPR) repeat protein
MYIKGRNWNMRRKNRRSNPLRILILVMVIALLVYIDQRVEPFSPYIFLPTPTPTLSAATFITEAQSYAVEGKYTQALAAYAKAIKADPQNPSNYIASAMINVYRGDYEAALGDASNALLLKPDNSQAYAIMGIAQGLIGDYLDSESSLTKAVEYDPSNYFAYAYDAVVKAQKILEGSAAQGDLDLAIEASRKAEAISPSALETHWARGAVLELTANYEDAVAEYEAAIAVNSNVSEIHISLGRTYVSMLEYTKAVEEYTKANALNPTDPIPDALIGRTYIRTGEYSKAAQYYQQAISDDPSNAYYWGNLGYAYYKNYQFGDAILALQLAIRGGLTTNGVVVEGLPLSTDVVTFYSAYGLALMQLGYCENNAVPIAQAIIQTMADDADAVWNAEYILEQCYQKMNNAQLLKLPTATMIPTWTPQPTATPTPLPYQVAVPTATGD